MEQQENCTGNNGTHREGSGIVDRSKTLFCHNKTFRIVPHFTYFRMAKTGQNYIHK